MSENFVYRPYVIIQDSREQSVFSFRNIRADKKEGGGAIIVRAKVAALKTGDYSIEGLEDRVSVERKSMEDLFNCMGSDRERFERQLSRLSEMEFGCVVVEADLARIQRGHDISKLNPKTVIRSVISYQMQHFPSVHFWFCPGKHYAEDLTFRILDRFYRKHGKETKKA